MSKFKVGDIVRANSKSDIMYRYTNSEHRTFGKVLEYLGEHVMKIRILSIDSNISLEAGSTACVNEKYFDLVKNDNECIVIYHKDNQVIAVDKKTGKKAIAKCNPKDEFDFKVGAKLAFDRLNGEEQKGNLKIGDFAKVTYEYNGFPLGSYVQISSELDKLGCYYVIGYNEYRKSLAEMSMHEEWLKKV